PFPLVGLDRTLKKIRRQAAANVPQRGVAPFPLVGLDRTLKKIRRQAAANVPQRGVAPFPLVGLDRTLKKIRRQAEHNISRASGATQHYLTPAGLSSPATGANSRSAVPPTSPAAIGAMIVR
ncbi:MAG: hypothetical protein IKC89_00785, partial [Lentisphaeria bacterium]|nr:hypothetical protein [Lentisphaeria bacterium]